MFRWRGDQQQSDSQSADRQQRAARRTIKKLDLELVLSDEEPFLDANTSLSTNLNLDGEPADESTSSETSAIMPDNNPVLFEDANADDDAEAWKKDLKIQWNQHDVKYWFNSVEAQMKKFGINKQWSKKDAIVPLLPPEVVEECMPIL